jgi:hypothetical protein
MVRKTNRKRNKGIKERLRTNKLNERKTERNEKERTKLKKRRK